MSRLTVYEAFENYEFIYEKDPEKLTNYICGNLTSWSPNCAYWQEQYQLATDLFNVVQWRKSKGYKPFAKKGEKICDGKLTFFLENEFYKR